MTCTRRIALCLIASLIVACNTSPTTIVVQATLTADPTSTPTAIPSTHTFTPTPPPTDIPFASDTPTPEPSPIRFVAFGDYGTESNDLLAVSELVKRLQPDFIITTGDNNYPNGEASTIDRHIGQYYHEYIYPYPGVFGEGAGVNRFFPSLGNHDWNTPGALPYLDYFTLPGNERYYDFVWGPVHFFAIDSDLREPDGVTSNSTQAAWLREQVAASSAPWQIVYFHHPPYSSALHGSNPWMQWPFAQWGVDAVLAGHDHVYERLNIEGIPNIITGLGGYSRYNFTTTLPGSEVRYNDDYGVLFVEATDRQLTFQFISVNDEVIDAYTVTR
jgi:hypothetical protein